MPHASFCNDVQPCVSLHVLCLHGLAYVASSDCLAAVVCGNLGGLCGGLHQRCGVRRLLCCRLVVPDQKVCPQRRFGVPMADGSAT